jgi:hypothetical protein
MNNRLKEFEELLLEITSLKMQDQALGNRNPKWKEWWQIIQKFTKEHIQNNMELVSMMNGVINLSYKATKLFSLISSMSHQVLCLWKSEPVTKF